MQEKRRTAHEVVRVGGLQGREGGREIEHNLIQVDGVIEVLVSPEQDTVTVQYDPAVTSGDYIRRTLNSLGYSPYLPN